MRQCFADISLATNVANQATHFRVPRIESFQTEQAIDNDVDSFSVDVGDVKGQLLGMIDRDTEVRVNLYCDDGTGAVQQVFSGLVDIDKLASDKTHTLQGSDVPSAVLMASDAEPGYWRHINPRQLLIDRCNTLGLTDVQVSSMSQVGRLWSDASEKEWAFQYRVARMGGCFMWSTDTGRLMIDALNYSASSYAYSLGHAPAGEPLANWIKVEDVSLISNKQQRVGRAVVYGEDKKKKGVVPSAVAVNPPGASIDRWIRRPTNYSTLSTARKQDDLQNEADLQVFESLVGSQEYTLTIGGDQFIQQNQMARVNLPEYGLVGLYYVVGVNRSGSLDGGLTQDVRLREKGYALDTRVPSAPKLAKQPSLASGLATSSIAEALTQQADIRWSAAFVRATREFLTPKGWDFSSALGVLLAICSIETGFKNGREIKTGSVAQEWFAMPTVLPDVNVSDPFTGNPFSPAKTLLNGLQPNTLAQAQQEWRRMFANSSSNPYNPFRPREAGTGPMQLTSISLKQEADGYGWSGASPVGTPEYAGGRWNPESNIRAAAHYLADIAVAVGADPTNFDTIWKAVAAYNAGVAGALAGGGTTYAGKVRALFKSTYGPAASVSSSTATVQQTLAGKAIYTFTDGQGNTIVSLPEEAPRTVAKAITYAMSLRGQSLYLWAGAGQLDASGTPRFDCSSFVTQCLVIGDPGLKGGVNPPDPATNSHGDTTYALWMKGTPVSKDQLLPGDVLFFDGIEHGETVPQGHVGLYLGSGEFIADPSSGQYVTISSLNSPYYRDRYNGARRFFYWPSKDHSH